MNLNDPLKINCTITLPVLIPDEEKITEIFIFTLLCGALIKSFETPQRSMKIKISVNFYFNINFSYEQDWKG